MTPRRRRRLAVSRPKDDREIVIVNGREMSCAAFKELAEIRMRRHDALPSVGYRNLCNEFNLHAGDVATLARRGASPEEVRQKALRKLGLPVG
jgi:hypothetical protein